MKLRLPAELHTAAMGCAVAVGDGLGEWIGKAVRADRAGRFTGVEVDEKSLFSTRAGSVVAWADVEEDGGGGGAVTPGDVRIAVARAVAYCAAAAGKVKPFRTAMVEGKDYIVDEKE